MNHAPKNTEQNHIAQSWSLVTSLVLSFFFVTTFFNQVNCKKPLYIGFWAHLTQHHVANKEI